MKQHLQQESEAKFSRQVGNCQVKPEVESAGTNRSEALGQEANLQQTAELNVALTRQLVEQRRRLRRMIGIALGFVLVMSPLAMRALLPLAKLIVHLTGAYAAWTTFLLSPLWIIANLSVVVGFVSYAIITDTKRRRKARKAVGALRTVADLKSVGPLVDALKLDDLPARHAARDMLIELLPRLQPEDSALLNTMQRAKLYSVLNVPVESALYKDVTAIFKPADDREVAIRVAILHALTRIGDDQALQIVAYLAETQAKTDGERRIQESARICLPLLHERVVQLRDPHTLLRASAAEFTNPEVLLRPAAQSGETPADQLLRAATPGS